MWPAFLTALSFAGSGICGQRSAVGFGSLRGNTLRLALSALVLGLLALLLGLIPWSSLTAQRFLYSGLVGFGVGDVALFLAYPRLGSRLTLLVNLCCAPLAGALGDWLLLGTPTAATQWFPTTMILSGVALALAGGGPWRGVVPDSRRILSGLAAAVLAGMGQGFGASLSRYAKVAAVAEGVRLYGVNEAFLRSLPGLAFSAGLWWLAGRWAGRSTAPPARDATLDRWRWWWLLGAAGFGPIIGVSCFQWALGLAPSSLVLSITATTPILVIPLAMIFEKDRPGPLAAIGALLAVAGVILLLH